MKILITCPQGLLSVLKTEIKHLGYTSQDVFQRGISLDGDDEAIMKINLRSRIANKVYLQLSQGNIDNFDDFFDLISTCSWSKYISPGQGISIQVFSKNSQLSSTKTLQSLANKSIYKKLTGDNTKQRNINSNISPIEVLIWIENDVVQIFINTSGTSLHERGWRKKHGEAPVKENIAAGLVYMSGWKYNKTLCDPFCGSGTILIEAAMIAKNIAPGLQRKFAFEQFSSHNATLFEHLKQEAQKKTFKDKTYTLKGIDIDSKVLHIAQQNALQAGVEDCISREHKDFLLTCKNLTNPNDHRIITNPPYGKRLSSKDLSGLYQNLIELFEKHHLHGGFLSGYTECKELLHTSYRNQKKLMNGADECNFYHYIKS